MKSKRHIKVSLFAATLTVVAVVLATSIGATAHGELAIADGVQARVVSLPAPEPVPAMGIDVQPAPADATPAIGADSALKSALAEIPPDSKSVTLSLVVYSNDQMGQAEPILVWLVQGEGACLTGHGPDAVSCDHHEMNAVINANTGEDLGAYSYR
jgi:hypothetical protein